MTASSSHAAGRAENSFPASISAGDALRAQVCRAAMLCDVGIGATAAALGMSEKGLRDWLERRVGERWPAAPAVLADFMKLPIAVPKGVLGPVSRLCRIAEDLRHLPKDTIKGKDRTRRAVRVRQAVCWAIRTHYGSEWSYPQIARALGLDHSTVVYHVRQAGEHMKRDEDYAAFCQILLIHAAGGDAPTIAPVSLPEWATDPLGWLGRRREAEAEAALATLGEDDPIFEADRHERGAARAAAAGSRQLLAALKRAHPERCAA